jgi:uncharacterized protein
MVLSGSGCPLAATVRVPTGGDPPYPAMIFTGPLSSVRNQVVRGYAERLADLGYVTLTLDHRNFGESAGIPRQHEDPQGKLCDLRSAVTELTRHPAVDGDRITLCGISVGAGYAVQATAADPRVAAVVAVAGAFNSPQRAFRQLGAAAYRQMLRRLMSVEFGPDGERAYLPVVNTGSGPAMMAGEDQYAYFSGRGQDPHWENRITAVSAYNLLTVDAQSAVQLIGEVPMLVVHGRQDPYCLPEIAREVHGQATGPSRLVWLDTHTHTAFYDDPGTLDSVVGAIVDFLRRYLPRRAT